MTEGQGWHNEPYEHDLARQGVSTKGKSSKKQPIITEEQAQEMAAQLQGKSTSHISQEKAQMSWFEEHWINGQALPADKLDELDIEDLQAVRKSAEEHIQQSTAAVEHKQFYENEMDRIKSKIGEKLKDKMRTLERELDAINS